MFRSIFKRGLSKTKTAAASGDRDISVQSEARSARKEMPAVERWRRSSEVEDSEQKPPLLLMLDVAWCGRTLRVE
jgi:hypothetical protein